MQRTKSTTNISHWKLAGVPRSERAEQFREKHLAKPNDRESTAFLLSTSRPRQISACTNSAIRLFHSWISFKDAIRALLQINFTLQAREKVV
ncbi:MAG: hypothetical protein LBG83_00925 [Oscillospiraceae bacterium]|jgi:predicted Zn-dependent peptidase|nr:hypothetical protein [Oscillospiraceae bacterium]